MDNICYVASAGAGKTTWLVNSILSRINEIATSKKIGVITFTIKNQEVIKKRIIEKHGFLPSNVYVLGWFEFLMRFIINPYKSSIIPCLYKESIGFILVEGCSGVFKDAKGNYSRSYRKGDAVKKYLTRDKSKFYSDMLSEFACECIIKNKTSIKNRMNSIFDSLYLDEAQDFVGYDYEVIKYLIKFDDVRYIIAADPRQHTFSTHAARIYKKYSGRIDLFLEEKVNTSSRRYVLIDNHSLSTSHRCNKDVCELSSKLTSSYPPTEYCECDRCKLKREEYAGLIGCFLVKESDVGEFCSLYNPVALTWSQSIKIDPYIATRINFGKSKGWECNSSIIYCTSPMTKWLKDNNTKLSDESRAKFYVALTRARFLTALVVADNFDNSNVGIPFWEKGSHNSI